MINLSIKGVSEPIAEKLRERAARNHRSLQGELMAIIEAAAQDEASGLTRPEQTVAPRSRRETKSVDQIAAELRALFPQPAGGQRSVDIIRELRDSR